MRAASPLLGDGADMPVICPRCPRAPETDAAGLDALIEEWIGALDARERAEEPLTRARLEACRACAHLAGGTCALCGCYVRLRAAKKRQRCPDLPSRWPGAPAG